MSETLCNLFKSYNEKLSKTSINAYCNNIKVLSKLLKGNNISLTMFNNFSVVKNKIIGSDYSINTKKNLVNTIIVFLKSVDKENQIIEKYSELLDDLINELKESKKQFQKSEKEEKNWMTKKELEEHIMKIKNKIPSNIESYNDLYIYMLYIALLFHYNYPLRNDLSDSEIYPLSQEKNVKKNKQTNYLFLDKYNNKSKLVLQNYKTAKTYDDINIDVNKDISKELNKYLKELNKYKNNNFLDDNNNLFIDKYGRKFTRNAYTKFLNSGFPNKKISSSMIRKIIISDAYNIPKIESLSNIMGHSINEALASYAKK